MAAGNQGDVPWGLFGAAEDTKCIEADLGESRPSQHFNGLEVTEIVARRFLGVPYVTVSAHSRHMQQSCYLDSLEARRTLQNNAARA